MTFQLVLATDDQIVVWHTDHGHIYVFNVDAAGNRLTPGLSRDIAEAPVRAALLAEDARIFAEQQARERRLIR